MSVNKNFVVKNGFEVNTNLILADADTGRVGIGITNPQFTLDVVGGVGAEDIFISGVGTFSTLNADDLFINSGIITSIVSTSGTITFLSGTSLNYSGISTLGILTSNQITSQDLEVTGISTFNNVFLDGYLSVGGTTGQQNQVLISTGVGVTWKPSSNLRTSTSFTATSGQTSFSATYSIGFVDVYINGVKLTNTEFVATNGTSIVLNDPCFGSESVEIIAFEVEYPLTFSGITLQEEGAVVGTGIDAINFVGAAVTAVSVGAGSTIFVNAQLPLTSSSNVVVGIITATLLNSTNGTITNLTGTAGTITTFNSTNGTITNLTGTAGTITTFNSTNGTITNLTGTNVSVSGVTTSNSLSIGSTQVISSGRQLQNIVSLDATTTATIESAISNAPNDFTSLNISGISTLNNVIVGGATTALIVNGDARVTGILTIGTSSITLDGNTNVINVGTGLTITSTEIIIGSITIGSGSLTGTATSTTNIPNLTGAITSVNTTTSLGSFTSANLASALTDETGSGSVVFATSPTLVTPVLGVATATSIVVGSGVTINTSGINVSGIVTAITFVGDLTGTTTGNVTGNINSSGVSTVTSLVATDINASGIITATNGFVGALTGTASTAQGLTGTPNITVGVTTTSTLNVGTGGTIITTTSGGLVGIGTTNPTSKLTVSGNVSITGVVTATTFIGALTGTASTATLATSAQGLTGTPNITVGIITATGGFVSTANTTPVTIQLVGNQLTFNAVGIGSTTLTLF